MIFGGVADYYNFKNVRCQVPPKAIVFNYGWHTYWLVPESSKITGGLR